MSNKLPTVILGAGAAGLMAAIFAAGRGRRVVVLERTRDGGRKILVSGGGRCNILPSVADASRFVTDSSPNTLRKILTSWPLDEQRRFFEDEAGIALALEAETGKLFPVSNSARQVRDQLLTLLILGCLIALFLWDRLRYDVVALLALLASGTVLTPDFR